MNIDIMHIVTVLIVIFVSMTLHEVMHGVMALWLGDTTAKSEGRLTLNPLKHIDPFMTIILPVMLAAVNAPIFGGAKPVPFNPYALRHGEWGAALVAIAGPLTNLLIAFIMFAIYAVTGGSTGAFAGFLVTAVLVNLGFFAFNILPIPPLDGSRVLYAISPDGVRRILETVERYGIVLVFAIVLIASPVINTLMGVMINGIISIFSNIFGI